MMRTKRIICWLVLPACLAFGAMNAASAQEASDAARQACTPDAMRLCSEFIPDAGRVKTCMLRKRSQLSAACRSAMAAGHRGVRHREYHHRGRRHHHG